MAKRIKYLAFAALIISVPLLFAYFYGPKSELTLLSRLHYNTLFVYTPCLSKTETFDDGYVRFTYKRPPEFLSNTAVLFIDPMRIRGTKDPFQDAIEAISLDIPTTYAYKYKLPSKPVFPPAARTIKLKKGIGEIRPGDPSFKDYGPEYLYLTGKNGYIYKIELPFYLGRTGDTFWPLAALYQSGILSRLIPGCFPGYMPPRGFFEWFFTPCADKQLYYSGESILKSIEILE
jgi:hypothetical protein